MTDYSKIKTLDELEYQTQRLQRRADIQRERLEGYISPIRAAYNNYRQIARLGVQVLRHFFGSRKK